MPSFRPGPVMTVTGLFCYRGSWGSDTPARQVREGSA